MKLSIIIPVYNERDTLREILRRVRAVELTGVDKEIVVVNDASTDGSSEILAQEAELGDLRLFQHEHNLGKGTATREGMKHARGDVIIIQDADLEYDPADYAKLVGPIVDGQVSVVYGSRFLGSRKRMFFLNMVENKLMTFTTNVLYGAVLTDVGTCYKCFRSEVVKGISLSSKRFEFDQEFTAKILKRGHRILEVPISYHGRGPSEGKKVSWRDAPVVFWTLIKYRFVD